MFLTREDVSELLVTVSNVLYMAEDDAGVVVSSRCGPIVEEDQQVRLNYKPAVNVYTSEMLYIAVYESPFTGQMEELLKNSQGLFPRGRTHPEKMQNV